MGKVSSVRRKTRCSASCSESLMWTKSNTSAILEILLVCIINVNEVSTTMTAVKDTANDTRAFQRESLKKSSGFAHRARRLSLKKITLTIFVKRFSVRTSFVQYERQDYVLIRAGQKQCGVFPTCYHVVIGLCRVCRLVPIM